MEASGTPSVLIFNDQFEGLSGSELHSLQLAEHFKTIGWTPCLAGLFCGEPFRSLAKSKGITLHSLSELRSLSSSHFDIVWTHHKTAFFMAHVALRIRSKLTVHGILSPFASRERVPVWNGVDLSKKVLFLANSSETAQVVRKDSCDRYSVELLFNLVPCEFYQRQRRNYSTNVNRVLIVSNHVPNELRRCSDTLVSLGIEVLIIGRYDHAAYVDSATLDQYDVVVSIGKTVYYCLAQGVPVFVYDHHGGPGYMSMSELDLHEQYNFSGRSAPDRKSGDRLAQEIVGEYHMGVAAAKHFTSVATERYGVSYQIKRITDFMHECALPLPLLDDVEIRRARLQLYRDWKIIGGATFRLLRFHHAARLVFGMLTRLHRRIGRLFT